MKIIVNSDHNISLTQESIAGLESLVETSLGHLGARLTRVEVHLTDGSAGRSTGDDIRCRLEARPEGLNEEFVTDNASTVDGAVSGALHKMVNVLDTVFGRLDHRKGGDSMGGVEPR
ncbi:MAG: hypothetical protein KF761_13340 [Salinibacterium sp.]|nr:hypothetical protein [Salinibacterium sp.]